MSFFCYVGTLPCGCTPAAWVDKPEWAKDTAKNVADMIKGGMAVTRLELQDGETVKITRCIHKEPPTPQAELFTQQAAK